MTPTSNHNRVTIWVILTMLYIFWLLHQTTTAHFVKTLPSRCISFDSYIKPQLVIPGNETIKVVYLLTPTSNHNLLANTVCNPCVVYLLTPTSNHNLHFVLWFIYMLYIFWLLHQTTTHLSCGIVTLCCISFDSYIKPQLRISSLKKSPGCISFDSYIKPQLLGTELIFAIGCISFDSYIKPQLFVL